MLTLPRFGFARGGQNNSPLQGEGSTPPHGTWTPGTKIFLPSFTPGKINFLVLIFQKGAQNVIFWTFFKPKFFSESARKYFTQGDERNPPPRCSTLAPPDFGLERVNLGKHPKNWIPLVGKKVSVVKV